MGRSFGDSASFGKRMEYHAMNNFEKFNKIKNPMIYRRRGKESYLDPVRQQLIYVTPEETVRQRTIHYLLQELNVPLNMLKVEEPLSHYGIKTRQRADIIITAFDEEKNIKFPLAIIECKAPNIMIGDIEHAQGFGYADQLCCQYVSILNGRNIFSYYYDDAQDKYILIEQLPPYDDMLQGKYKALPVADNFKRCPYDKLYSLIEALKEEYIFAPGSDDNLLFPVANFYECLMDTSHKLPIGNYGLFKVVEDYGIRYMTYGNASGYSYSNAYRSFVVDIDGSIEFISLGVNAYSANRTIICVAIDRDDGSPHHALQLAVDSFIVLDGQKCSFGHNGRIAVGRSGSGKAADLKKLLKQYAQHLMVNDEIRLGGFAYTANVFIDEPQMVQFVSNLINYSIVRDKYRNALSS